MNKSKIFISSIFFLTTLFSVNTYSQEYSLTQSEVLAMQDRLGSMSYLELQERKVELESKISLIENEEISNEEISELSEEAIIEGIRFELLEINRLLLVVGGVGILGSIFEDDSRDTTPPIITLTGPNPAIVERGDAYVDAGATANGGETVSVNLGGLNTNVAATYTITYTATDASGNTGYANRTVNVVDTTAPVVTVTGTNPASVELGATYTDAGATTTEGTVTSSGTVDTSSVGTYTITYTATDASGNA
jgi:hypothetical protein